MEIHLKIWYNNLSEVFMQRKMQLCIPEKAVCRMDSFYTER